MNNKRIHELLEYVKAHTKERTITIDSNSTITMYPDPLYEIVQHLLEVEIKRTEMEEKWFITLEKRQKHDTGKDGFIDRGPPKPHGCLPNCPECKYAREYYKRNRDTY